MEKHTPHHKLALVKSLVQAGKAGATMTARTGAAELEIEESEMWAVVAALQRSDFYKSMTSHANHKVWQDVYRPVTEYGQIYLKFTVEDGVLVLLVSFKEL